MAAWARRRPTAKLINAASSGGWTTKTAGKCVWVRERGADSQEVKQMRTREGGERGSSRVARHSYEFTLGFGPGKERRTASLLACELRATDQASSDERMSFHL